MQRAPSDGRSGMTLLELLLVMFLLALILGGGVAMFTGLDLGKRQAAGLVRNVLRSAQNTAIASSAPARARIDKTAGTIRAESLITVGTYCFEGKSITGYGPAGAAEPEDFDERGFVGACYRPAGRMKAEATIPLQRDPAFDFTLGFAIDVAIFRETESSGRILSLGPSESPTLGLDLGKAGGLRARMRTRVGDAASDRPGAAVIIESDPGLVPVGRWMQVRMRYDRARFELLLDGTVIAAQDDDRYVWRVDEPLVLSDGALPFPGRIDNLVLAAMVAGEPTALPESVRFAPDSPATVQFAAGGGLDRTAHADPARIGLDFEDGSRETVLVGLFGTVE